MGGKQVQQQRCPIHATLYESLLVLTFGQPRCTVKSKEWGLELQLSDKARLDVQGPGSIPRTAERAGNERSPQAYF